MKNQICTVHEIEMEWVEDDQGGHWFCDGCYIEEENAVLFDDEHMEDILMAIFDEEGNQE